MPARILVAEIVKRGTFAADNGQELDGGNAKVAPLVMAAGRAVFFVAGFFPPVSELQILR
ncbi:MAG: hypothetical protein ABSH28_04520 [Acidobacteriota bacterium]